MVTKCSLCDNIITCSPKEAGWTKIDGKYVCVWCEDVPKTEYKHEKMRTMRASGIYRIRTRTETKPLISKNGE